MAVYEELTVDQGATFRYQVVLRETSDESEFDLTGYTAAAHMKRSHRAASITETFTCVVDSPRGVITISLTDEQTAAIKPGRYVFDIVLSSPTGTVDRVTEGIVDITPAVTIL